MNMMNMFLAAMIVDITDFVAAGKRSGDLVRVLGAVLASWGRVHRPYGKICDSALDLIGFTPCPGRK